MFTLILIGELDRSSTVELETAIEGLCEGKSRESHWI